MECDKLSTTDLPLKEQPKKSLAKKLKAIHNEIEEALAIGVSHQTILKALEQRGLGAIPITTFKSNLYRLRKEMKKSNRSWTRQSNHATDPACSNAETDRPFTTIGNRHASPAPRQIFKPAFGPGNNDLDYSPNKDLSEFF